MYGRASHRHESSTALEPLRVSILTTTGEICQEASFQMIGERQPVIFTTTAKLG
jgi:hypothetical protein